MQFGRIWFYSWFWRWPYSLKFQSPGIPHQPPHYQAITRAHIINLVMLGLVFALPQFRQCVLESFGSFKNRTGSLFWRFLKTAIIVFLAVYFLRYINFVIHFTAKNQLHGIDDYLFLMKYTFDVSFVSPFHEISEIKMRPDLVLGTGSLPIFLFDLLIGTTLGVLREEFKYRAVMRRFLVRFMRNPILIVLLSSLFFGLFHWFQGPVSMLSNFILGVVLMAVFLKTGSLTLPILIHLFHNLPGRFYWHL